MICSTDRKAETKLKDHAPIRDIALKIASRIHLQKIWNFICLIEPFSWNVLLYQSWSTKLVGSALFCSVIGPGYSCNFLNQSNAKLKPITTWSPAFSRALDGLVVFTSHRPLKEIYSDWMLWLFWFWFYDPQWSALL